MPVKTSSYPSCSDVSCKSYCTQIPWDAAEPETLHETSNTEEKADAESHVSSSIQEELVEKPVQLGPPTKTLLSRCFDVLELKEGLMRFKDDLFCPRERLRQPEEFTCCISYIAGCFCLLAGVYSLCL